MKNVHIEPIIGLEIHVELKTKSKMFCGCPADWFGKKPNTCCCPVCLGLPGALPVPNRKAIEWCIKLGHALNCEIPLFSKFDRKNYFYPDLPKGYQISQYDKPFCVNGWLEIKEQGTNNKEQKKKRIRIRRVHMEEDTGKLLHTVIGGKKCTLIDFNRSGVPLVEIVTEPDIRSSEEARMFLKKLHQIIRYLGISDADMEKGSMRLEPNISVRIKEQRTKNKEQELPDYKVEVKNINSFSFVRKAIDYEIARHVEILKEGKIPKQETRGWDEKKGSTYSQRSKEEAHDYRYFPEPDIPPIHWTESQISNLKSQIPELADQKIARFMKDYRLSQYDVTILTENIETADYFERAVELARHRLAKQGDAFNTKTLANWIINKKVDISKISPEKLVEQISQKQSAVHIDEKELEKAIDKALTVNTKAAEDYKSGKLASLMFLVGQVMKEVKGKADASAVRKLLEKKLQ